MAIMWIQYTSNEIMDLLKLFGFVTSLPESLLALTIISWGNCLGDMTADVAMGMTVAHVLDKRSKWCFVEDKGNECMQCEMVRDL